MAENNDAGKDLIEQLKQLMGEPKKDVVGAPKEKPVLPEVTDKKSEEEPRVRLVMFNPDALGNEPSKNDRTPIRLEVIESDKQIKKEGQTEVIGSEVTHTPGESALASKSEPAGTQIPKKPDTTSWDNLPSDRVFSRGGGEGAKAYFIDGKSSIFAPEEEKRNATLTRVFGPVDGQTLDKIAMEICDPFNPHGLIDSNGFLNLKDENDKRIRVIFKDANDNGAGNEAQLHLIAKTASNLILKGDLRGEELDLTPAYVDLKAFYVLVGEKGPKETLRLVIDDSNALTPYKNAIRAELKSQKKDRIHEELVKAQMAEYIQGKLGFNPRELHSVVLKIPIEGKVNADARLLRAREKAISRTGLGIKRLYTAETVGDRDAAIMIPMGTLDIETARKIFGFEGILKKIAIPVLEDLAQLHDTWGFEHRDIKPDNVMLDKSKGRAVIGDFSVAKVEKQRSDLTRGVAIGTPMYMSKRQAKGEDTDIRDDIYSFGRTIESFFTGNPPYSLETSTEIMAAIINGQKPFALTHSKHKQSMNEGLGINGWYSYLNPVKLVKWFKRRDFIKKVEKVLAWTCSENGPTSYRELKEDLEFIVEGKNPINLNAFLHQSNLNYKTIINAAYETSGKVMSEEARQAVIKERNKWMLISALATALGVASGVGLTKGYEYLSQKVEQAKQYQNHK